MKKPSLFRSLALVLVLALALSVPAGALTPQQTAQLLEENYVDPVDPEILALPTVDEMLDALGDPYTQYMDAPTYAAFLATMADDTLVGIGVSIDSSLTADDPFLLLEVFEEGPAAKGGLLAGDIIVAVDHVDVTGMDPDDIIARIRGEEGSQVVITYLRDGARTTVTLTRETVSIPATTGTMLEGGVCYIQCTAWGEETLWHFLELMAQYRDQTQCWLIDLRNNLGGLTDAAANVAGLFCGPGNMVSLRQRSQSEDSPDGYAYQFYPSRRSASTDKPVVILVNEQSASASEVFTAALRDYDRAVVVGERTYGKGVAQGIWDQDSSPLLFPDGGALKLTVARFYSPIGNTNDAVGIIPDFLVYGQEAEDLALALAQTYAEDPAGWQVFTQDIQAQVVEDSAFEDTDADDAYRDAAATLRAYELVSGKGDGLFRGEDTLTRAELAQMLANALRSWVPEKAPAFADVDPDAWYAEAVAAIAAQGMMVGTGEGQFSPQATLTRQELFTVLGRMAAWLNDDVDLVLRRAEASDWDLRVLRDYADWARPSVWLLSCALDSDEGGLVNLLWDLPESIDPTAPATRGEAAQVLYDILYYLTLLP